MALSIAPRLDTRPVPGDIEDCLIAVIDDELQAQGYARYVEQPVADNLKYAATAALWQDDATLAQAARYAVNRHASRLIREVPACIE